MQVKISALAELERTIESITGMTIEVIREMPVIEMKEIVEAKYGKPMAVTIGGKPSSHLLSNDQIERMLNKALRD